MGVALIPLEGRLVSPVVVRPQPEGPLAPELAELDPRLAELLGDKALVQYAASGEWEREAACQGEQWKDFFPDPKLRSNSNLYKRSVDRAKVLCGNCAVRGACRIAAYLTCEQDGVWGGLDANERVETQASKKRHAREAAEQRKAAKAA